MKVIEKSTMPNGTEIQIEDWSQNYDFMPYAGTVAAYPIARESGDGTFSPQRGKPFRLAFDFKTTENAAVCFEQLKKGEKQLTDFADVACKPNFMDCL